MVFDAFADRHRRISRPGAVLRKPLDTVFLYCVRYRGVLRDSWALHGRRYLLLPLRGRFLDGLDHLYGYCCACWNYGVPCPGNNNGTRGPATAATPALPACRWTAPEPN